MTTSDAQVITLKNRCRTFRAQILEMITKAGSGHPGGSLSAIDLIASLLSAWLFWKANLGGAAGR